MRIGVISDTHGSLHSRVVEVFRGAGVERILHGGDVGEFGVISALSGIAMMDAVRGNIDRAGLVASLPGEIRMTVEGVDMYVTHIGGKPGVWLSRLKEPRPRVAICGHSHVPLLEEMGGVLFLNPGAGGTQARFGRPQSVALLRVEAGKVEAEIVIL
ncbi:MAG: metallophosphoesterase family protein [Chloroflexia bacterium]